MTYTIPHTLFLWSFILLAIIHERWLLHLQSVEMESGVKVNRRIGSLLSGMRLHVYSRGEGLIQLAKYALFLITQQLDPGKPLKTHIHRHTYTLFSVNVPLKQITANESHSDWYWLIKCKLQWLSYMHFLWNVEILEINDSMFFKGNEAVENVTFLVMKTATLFCVNML